MPARPPTARAFRKVTLDALAVDDERSMRDVALYAPLKALLVRDRYAFRVPQKGAGPLDWNRALFLNLSFWTPGDGADVLIDARIPADVVAHVGWHHAASRALGTAGRSADGLSLAESIASAFDLYLVGRHLAHAPRSAFLETQVPAMAEITESAGMPPADFRRLLSEIAADPEGSFADLRSLLFTAASRLVRAKGADDAARILGRLGGHRFHALIHHYNLSNWVLYAKAHAAKPRAAVPAGIAVIDRKLRGRGGLAWLGREWVLPLAG